MRVREFPVLTEDDEPLVDRLAVGLDDDSARTLAYLLRRAEQPAFADEPATLLAVQVGTEQNRSTVRAALDRLEERGLVAGTTIRDETPGRPPKAWRAPRGIERTVERAYDLHAARLLERAERFPDELGASAPAGDPQPQPDAVSLSVALNWRPNGLHAPLFLADADGAYADRNLDVAFESHEGSRAALDSVVAGDADLGIAGAATVLRARATGEPVVPIASLFQHAMTTIYALAGTFDEPFERAAQLQGRRVGTPVASEVGLLSRLFLRQAGVLDRVEVLDLRGEEQEALLSGEVDAVTGSFSDPRRLAAEGRSVESVAVADRFPIPGPAIVAAESTLADRRPELAAFLSGTAAGWAAAKENPSQAASAVAAESDRAADRERRTFEAAVAEFGASDAVRNHGWGWRQTEAWRRLRTALEQVELLDGEPA